MGFGETIVKVVFWSRVRKAKKIGQAAELIGQGRADETLRILESMERRIPPYVGHLFFLTRGRALDELRRTEEAEQSYTAAVFAKEGATVAYIHLAVLCGRQKRYDDARDWLRRIRDDEEADPSLLDQADELKTMLDDVESGHREEELHNRARQFAEQQELQKLDLDTALMKLDQWIDTHPELAHSECDELACSIGELVADEHDGRWSVSLALEDCSINFEKPDSKDLSPFEIVRARLNHEGSLVELYRKARG